MRKRVFFTMESQCREAKKEGNFLPNISICISKSSSEAENEQKRQEREKGERGKREMRRRGKRERERTMNGCLEQTPQSENPRRVGPRPHYSCAFCPFWSMWWNTGFHAVVFTYAP